MLSPRHGAAVSACASAEEEEEEDLAATQSIESCEEPPAKCARRSTPRTRASASLSRRHSRCCFVRVYVKESEQYLYLSLEAVPVTPLAVACSAAGAQSWLRPRATAEEQEHALAALECPFSALGVSNASPLAGTGASAIVLKTVWQGRCVAVKVFRQGHTERYYENELRVLSQIGVHPNLVNVLGHCPSPRALVMEYSELGSLFDLLHNERELVTRQSVFETSSNSNGSSSSSSTGSTGAAARAVAQHGSLLGALMAWRPQLVRDIARGMEHLHSRHCVHLDLTSRNVLLTCDFHAKITDYGLSVMTVDGELATRQLGHAPSYWKAPELCHRAPATLSSAAAGAPRRSRARAVPSPAPFLLATVDESLSVSSPAVPSQLTGLSDASTPSSPATALQGSGTAPVPEHEHNPVSPNAAAAAAAVQPKPSRRVFTPKVDVFSFGMVLWELFHPGKFPWDGDLHPDVRLQHGERPPVSAAVSPAWQMLIVACWQQCAAHRPSSHDIVVWLERNFAALRSL